MDETVAPVTLLIPNYNGSRFLEQTLRQLLSQTYQHFSLLVIDDGSTDHSSEIVRSFSDSRVRWHAGPHLGLPGNFNRAVEQVSSRYFATCSYDEMYEPDWLGTMVRLLEENPRSYFACCKADSCDEEGRIFLAPPERYKDSFWPGGEPAVFEKRRAVPLLMHGCYLVCTVGLYRTEAFRRIGYFNPEWKFVGDWEHFVRGLLADYTIVGTHRRLAHYRRHKQMATQKLGPMLRFTEYVRLADWIADVAHEHQLLPERRVNHSVTRNQLLSEFADHLSRGNYVSADELLQLARSELPGFRGSSIDFLSHIARTLGRSGGFLLSAVRASLLRIAPTLAHD